MQTNDIRTTAVLLTSAINNMCNTQDVEAIANYFVECKDLLIALYKLNVERCQDN